MRTIIILLIAMLCMACKTQFTTNYKLVTKKRNYYTDTIASVNDSIMFHEKHRNGKPKEHLVVPYSSTKIILSK
ncbi:hypothetical protein [uncultured Flavobacterium sp.]|uniref:hypothetical protein n=1 Tax=uncultured Flavobacterium sp. TaxID=165435 RepID=UPI0025F7B6A9|nr:hypothetical protein [uncultured Flavobacterium sp.]